MVLATALGASLACGGAMSVEDYSAACGEYTRQLAESQGTAKAYSDLSTSMEKLSPPQELNALHHWILDPGWSSAEAEREIIKAFEDALGVKVYSDEIPFEKMMATIEDEARKQWGDQASESLVERIDLEAILERTMESQQRMGEAAAKAIRILENLSPETRGILLAEGCMPEAVEEDLQQ